MFPALFFGKSCQIQRKFHILKGCKDWNQVVELEDETYIRGTPLGKLCFRKQSDIDAPYSDRTAVRPVDTGNQVEKRGLP